MISNRHWDESVWVFAAVAYANDTCRDWWIGQVHVPPTAARRVDRLVGVLTAFVAQEDFDHLWMQKGVVRRLEQPRGFERFDELDRAHLLIEA